MKKILLQFFLINGCGLRKIDYFKYWLIFMLWMALGTGIVIFATETNVLSESLTYFTGSMGAVIFIIAIAKMKVIITCMSLCSSCERKKFYITCKRKDYNLKYTPAVIRGLLGAYIILVCIAYYVAVFIRNVAD